MNIEIKRWPDGTVIHSGDFESVKACLEAGVKREISFNYAELNGAELNNAKLNYAELNDAKLNDAELNDAELNYAELNRAELNGAELNGAELNRAELNGAELNGAELNGAELNRAKLNGAYIDFSAWPLWCGSLGVIVDKRIAAQLAYHFCRLVCDDEEVKAAQQAIKTLANQMHRTDVPRIE